MSSHFLAKQESRKSSQRKESTSKNGTMMASGEDAAASFRSSSVATAEKQTMNIADATRTIGTQTGSNNVVEEERCLLLTTSDEPPNAANQKHRNAGAKQKQDTLDEVSSPGAHQVRAFGGQFPACQGIGNSSQSASTAGVEFDDNNERDALLELKRSPSPQRRRSSRMDQTDTNEDDEDHQHPGAAVEVRGRAFGQIPVWGRYRAPQTPRTPSSNPSLLERVLSTGGSRDLENPVTVATPVASEKLQEAIVVTTEEKQEAESPQIDKIPARTHDENELQDGTERIDIFVSFHGGQEISLGTNDTFAIRDVVLKLEDRVLQQTWLEEGHIGRLSTFYYDDVFTINKDSRLSDSFDGLLETRGGGVVAILAVPGYFYSELCLTELAAAFQLAEQELVSICFIAVGMTIDEIKNTPVTKVHLLQKYVETYEEQVHYIELKQWEGFMDSSLDVLADKIASFIVGSARRVVAGRSYTECFHTVVTEIWKLMRGSHNKDYFLSTFNNGDEDGILEALANVGFLEMDEFFPCASSDDSVISCRSKLDAFQRKWHAPWCARRRWSSDKRGLMQIREHLIESLQRQSEGSLREPTTIANDKRSSIKRFLNRPTPDALKRANAISEELDTLQKKVSRVEASRNPFGKRKKLKAIQERIEKLKREQARNKSWQYQKQNESSEESLEAGKFFNEAKNSRTTSSRQRNESSNSSESRTAKKEAGMGNVVSHKEFASLRAQVEKLAAGKRKDDDQKTGSGQANASMHPLELEADILSKVEIGTALNMDRLNQHAEELAQQKDDTNELRRYLDQTLLDRNEGSERGAQVLGAPEQVEDLEKDDQNDSRASMAQGLDTPEQTAELGHVEKEEGKVVTRKEFAALKAQVQKLAAGSSKDDEREVGGGQVMAYMLPLEPIQQVEKLAQLEKDTALNADRLNRHAKEIAKQKNDTKELRRYFDQKLQLDRNDGLERIAQVLDASEQAEELEPSAKGDVGSHQEYATLKAEVKEFADHPDEDEHLPQERVQTFTKWLVPETDAEEEVGMFPRIEATLSSSPLAGPCVFVSHAEETMEDIARPTFWFVTQCLKINAFIHDVTPASQKSPSTSVAKATYECSHGIVLLSPKFRHSKYCVMELNTLLKRQQVDSLTLLACLWNKTSLDDYAESAQDIAWIQPDATDAALYILRTLWPQLLRVLKRDVEEPLEYYLTQYVDQNRGIVQIPDSLERLRQSLITYGQRWERLPLPMTPRVGCGVALWGDYCIIIVGGTSSAPAVRLKTLGSVEFFDARLQAWQQLPDLVTPRKDCTAAVVDDVLHVFGGWDGSTTFESWEILRLNDVGRGFKTLDEKLPEPRREMGSLVLDEFVFLVGGRLNPYGDNFYRVNTRERAISAIGTMIVGRACPVVVRDKNEVIVLGGRGKDGKRLKSVHVYHISSGQWSTDKIPDLPKKSGRVLRAFMDNDGSLVVHTKTSVYVYDFQDEAWISEESQSWTIGRRIERCVLSDSNKSLVCVNAAEYFEVFSLATKDEKNSRLFTTANLDGVCKPVGELSVPYVSDPGKAWPMRTSGGPLLYLAHHGRDTKEEIVKPLSWYLRDIYGVDTFFDKDSMPMCEDKMQTLISNAHKCTHAIVLLSPNFRSSEYCVRELNTFMARNEKGGGFRLFISIWGCVELNDYAPEVSEVISHREFAVNRPNKPKYFHSLTGEIGSILGNANG